MDFKDLNPDFFGGLGIGLLAAEGAVVPVLGVCKLLSKLA